MTPPPHADERIAFVTRHVERVELLMRETNLADWDAAANGTEEANERLARLTAEMLAVYANPDDFCLLSAWRGSPTGDPLLDRQIELLSLTFEGSQQDEETIHQVTEIEKSVRATYVGYRGIVGGRPLSDNELGDVLADSSNTEEVRAAWEASKQVGQQVEERVLELVQVRNRAARRMGFADHWRKELQLSELREASLFHILDDLAAQTEAPFARAKEQLDSTLARRFGVGTDELRPWHYGDPFFQRVPRAAGGLDELFAGRQLEALATATFDGMGLEVRPILARSDLYERPGKNQHAFCTAIDRRDDIRVLCNLQSNERWMETLLHELGHGVYDQYLDPTLPFLLRCPAHVLTTEAIAMLMGRLVLDSTWLREVVEVDRLTVDRLLPAMRQRQRLGMLMFVRWVLVMVHFERALYTDPTSDLRTLWWDLVERYQQLRRPEGRHAPDWAAKIHLALYPVYYQNYMLGELVASQLQHVVQSDVGGLVGQPRAGQLLRDRLFAHGATRPWDAAVVVATGEPLQSRYFVEEFAQ